MLLAFRLRDWLMFCLVIPILSAKSCWVIFSSSRMQRIVSSAFAALISIYFLLFFCLTVTLAFATSTPSRSSSRISGSVSSPAAPTGAKRAAPSNRSEEHRIQLATIIPLKLIMICVAYD